MAIVLLILAVGTMVGMPIVLFGAMRLSEHGGWTGWAILLLGLCVFLGPVAAAIAKHQQTAGVGLYIGR